MMRDRGIHEMQIADQSRGHRRDVRNRRMAVSGLDPCRKCTVRMHFPDGRSRGGEGAAWRGRGGRRQRRGGDRVRNAERDQKMRSIVALCFLNPPQLHWSAVKTTATRRPLRLGPPRAAPPLGPPTDPPNATPGLFSSSPLKKYDTHIPRLGFLPTHVRVCMSCSVGDLRSPKLFV